MSHSDNAAKIRRLTPADLRMYESLMSLFGNVFDEPDTYTAARPCSEYVEALLQDDKFILLAAIVDGTVVGGVAAYELVKFEQQRSEVYIYDLAVAEAYRRRGIATSLIRAVCRIGAARNAWVVFVQADQGDDAPVSLYSKLGTAEHVLHFDIDIKPDAGTT